MWRDQVRRPGSLVFTYSGLDAFLPSQDFFSKDCFKGHPKPYAEFMDWRKKEDENIEVERQKLIPGM